jgi:hypothetical protein
MQKPIQVPQANEVEMHVDQRILYGSNELWIFSGHPRTIPNAPDLYLCPPKRPAGEIKTMRRRWPLAAEE